MKTATKRSLSKRPRRTSFGTQFENNPDAVKARDNDDEAASHLQNNLAAVNEDQDVDSMSTGDKDDDSATAVLEGVELEVLSKPNNPLT